MSERERDWTLTKTKKDWQELRELMEKTSPYPADYEGMQRIAAMLNQALSSKPLEDYHPHKTLKKH